MKRKHSKWISVDIDKLSDISKIPKSPACYVVYMKKETYKQYQLIYIGSSVRNVWERIYARIKMNSREKIIPRMFCSPSQAETLYFAHKNAFVYNLNTEGCTYKVKYKLSLRIGDVLMWELRLIRRLKPSCNGCTKKQKEETKEKEEMAYPWYCLKH